MNLLVRFTRDEDGDPVENDPWHLSDPSQSMGAPTKLCSGEVYGKGEGSAVFETKEVPRGGITCQKCLRELKIYKAVKL